MSLLGEPKRRNARNGERKDAAVAVSQCEPREK
jgi:hypothetical protein